MIRLLIILTIVFSSSMAFSRNLTCVSPNGLSYLSEGKMGGAAPFPGQILHITEIKKDGEVLYRKVFRQGCYSEEFCQMDRPELNDINADQETFSFIDDTKEVLSSEGSEMGPIHKETYAIMAKMDKEYWMICESFMAMYP